MHAFEDRFDSVFAVDDNTGMFLHNWVLEHQPKRILELGTWRGASAIYLASALQAIGAGELVSVDVQTNRVPMAEQNIASAGLAGFVTLVVMDIDEYLRKQNKGKFDLVFMDAEKKQQGQWLEKILSDFLNPKATILVDDAITMGERMGDLFALAQERKLKTRMENISDGIYVIAT